jgi:hypothetical protein
MCVVVLSSPTHLLSTQVDHHVSILERTVPCTTAYHMLGTVVVVWQSPRLGMDIVYRQHVAATAAWRSCMELKLFSKPSCRHEITTPLLWL